MRKLLSWILNAAAVVIFVVGCRAFVTAGEFFLDSVDYFGRATFHLVCSSPDESSDCAKLYADEPVWENGVVITDVDVLFTHAAFAMDFGSVFVTLGSFFVGMAGVILAASVIVSGQQKTRREVRDARDKQAERSAQPAEGHAGP